MALLKDVVFGPMLPKVEPELLPVTKAQLAQNLKHTSGALEQWKLPAAVGGMTMPGAPVVKTIYRFGKDTLSKLNYWFQFPGDVDILKGPVTTDTEERTYWTDGTYPKKTKSSLAGLTAGTAILPTSLRLGVPCPGWNGTGGALTFTPVATVSGVATDPTSTPLTSTYVITNVSTWNEESAPGNPSNIVVWRAGQTVTITCPATTIAGAYSLDRIRIYRSNTGTQRTTFQYRTEQVISTANFADTDATGATLGEVCTTFDWNPPPDGTIGLTDMGNGILAGFEKNTVYFCEPFVPYAWPAKYDMPVGAPIVGIAAFDQTLVVGTTAGLTLMTGTDPASMSMVSPKGSQACVSKRSMVEMMGGVVYAGPSGLIFVGPSGASNLTKDVLSHDQWQAYVPSSISGYCIDGRYYAFYDTGSVQACIIFSFGDDPGMVLCDQFATAAFVEDQTDSLFCVLRSGSTNTLNEWGTGSNMTAIWRSGEQRFNSGVCMSHAKVNAAAYPVTYKLYGDGVLKHTQTVADNLPFILPAGRNYTVSHQVEGAVKITSVRTATSAKELGDGNG